MDTDGARRLNRSSPSCLNSGAQRTDFFHGLVGPAWWAFSMCGLSPRSSPCVRGRHDYLVVLSAGRFIPARARPPVPSGGPLTSECGSFSRAGQPSLATARSFRSAVHPRACGATLRFRAASLFTRGSSPRARGRPRSPAPRPRVHPRARGAAMLGGSLSRGIWGSSPRARGRSSDPRHPHYSNWFIPARAGPPIGMLPVRRPSRVHPRACGAVQRPLRSAARGIGSSPRARGRLVPGQDSGPCGGFIPACAGPSRRRPPGLFCIWVHPCVRGTALWSDWLRGSVSRVQPRGRGALAGSFPALRG